MMFYLLGFQKGGNSSPALGRVLTLASKQDYKHREKLCLCGSSLSKLCSEAGTQVFTTPQE